MVKALLLGGGMDGLCNQPHTERGAYAADGIESRSAGGAQCFVQATAPAPPRVAASTIHTKNIPATAMP